jgi:hypothetical protein
MALLNIDARGFFFFFFFFFPFLSFFPSLFSRSLFTHDIKQSLEHTYEKSDEIDVSKCPIIAKQAIDIRQKGREILLVKC